MPSFRVKVKVKSDLKGLTKLKNSLKQSIADTTVQVGHFGGKFHPDGNGLTIAGLSLMQQQGNKRIPSRPYMAKAIEAPVFLAAYNEAVVRVAKGESKVGPELRKLGKLLSKAMKLSIVFRGPGFLANTFATLDQKEGSTPLIDSGVLLQDIGFRVVKDTNRKKQLGLNKVAQ